MRHVLKAVDERVALNAVRRAKAKASKSPVERELTDIGTDFEDFREDVASMVEGAAMENARETEGIKRDPVTGERDAHEFHRIYLASLESPLEAAQGPDHWSVQAPRPLTRDEAEYILRAVKKYGYL